jgi:hypothetical protein
MSCKAALVSLVVALQQRGRLDGWPILQTGTMSALTKRAPRDATLL